MAEFNLSYSADQVDTALGKVVNQDLTPTSGSDNTVSSNGVFTHVAQQVAAVDRGSDVDQLQTDVATLQELHLAQVSYGSFSSVPPDISSVELVRGDITAVVSQSIVTLNKAGIWRISASFRSAGSDFDEDLGATVWARVNGSNYRIVHGSLLRSGSAGLSYGDQATGGTFLYEATSGDQVSFAVGEFERSISSGYASFEFVGV